MPREQDDVNIPTDQTLAVLEAAFPVVNTPEWDAMNERRAHLIRKDLEEGLTPSEREEYERLQWLSRTVATS